MLAARQGNKVRFNLIRAGIVMAVLLMPPFAKVSEVMAEEWRQGTRARLQTLDKITARISTLDVPIGVALYFGTLEVFVYACHYRPPHLPPEHAAFLKITGVDYDGRIADAPLFEGWMFASSPALSGLEHPVYDLTVLSCNN